MRKIISVLLIKFEMGVMLLARDNDIVNDLQGHVALNLTRSKLNCT